MTLTTKLILIAALILSIIIPFGYYLIGERNRKKYKRAIGTNVFFFFGAFVITSIMMFAGPQVHAASHRAGHTLDVNSGKLLVFFRLSLIHI